MTPKTLESKIKKQKLLHNLNNISFKIIAISPILILTVDHFFFNNLFLSILESEYSRSTVTLAFSITICCTVVLNALLLIYFRKLSYEIVLHKLQKQFEILSSNASSKNKTYALDDDLIDLSREDAFYFLKLSQIYSRTVSGDGPHMRLIFMTPILMFTTGCIFYSLSLLVLNDLDTSKNYVLPLIINLVSITQILLSIFHFARLILTKKEKELLALNTLCNLDEV